MIESAAYLKTEHGSKYLVQLCKHFAHKVDVTYSDNHGKCRFDRGVATLDADAAGLRVTVKADDEESLGWGQSVIESHLVRFAFREELGAFDWQRQGEAA
ncbi:DUF2218 domain-containing protein [Sinorhizobium sp. RAC02]|uniref:DUF2218 domain-containing protein n=1 Tax=Sinorhizobium sp. RAC02 TaxID=1842534 RepID=UPI000855A5EA|nr:hypothetical protein BSY16_5362 [Sinorhizobium sp. RAC02]